ncbi:restriction endonuclease [Natrinema sp. CBA1119]|uniref:restriction endonuclease n=1 Tax=Natrinema sp. CBA1119 TaxID=1608465 RepID=UPI00159BB4E5|nr:restriction endonuclease [Natrinema sp. CBA1119]
MQNPQKLKSSLQELSANRFEEFVASVWDSMGWETKVTPSGRDKGIDIIATREGIVDEKVLIQAKRYSPGNKVGRPAIQQYNTLQQQVPDADSVIVVTTSRFTTEALELAKQLNIKTINGNNISEAAIDHISKEDLKQVISKSTTNTKQENSARPNEVSTEELSESEEDLAQVYQVYFRRLREAISQSEQRILYFDINRESGDTSEYSVMGTMHKVKFSSDNPEIWLKFQKTAKTYGWVIALSEAYGSGAGGVEMVMPPKESDTFYLAIETERGERILPQRQAKISSLILEHIYDQPLSGTEVTDMSQNHGKELYTRVVK